MKTLVIGSGGREHAIIKKLKENQSIEKIYALPGNGGIAADAECVAILSCFNDCNDNACFTQCEQDHPSGVAKEQAFYQCISGPKCGQACK